MQTETAITPKQAILTWAEKHGVTMSAQFVPFSQSRNKGEKSPSLNWRVTLSRNGRDILATDYSAGCGHCPAYKASIKEMGGKDCVMRAEAIRMECETGKKALVMPSGQVFVSNKVAILPELDSVLWSLSMDSSVIDAGGFEQWAADLGYDTDSRKAEAIYRECLDIALKLRAALGDEAMRELAEAGQDY